MENIQIALDKARQRQDQTLLARLAGKQPVHGPAPEPVPGPAAGSGKEPDREGIWANLPVLALDPAVLAANRVVTATRSDPAYVAFGMLRTRILQQMQHNSWTTIAVTSPTAGCGKTLVSLNLAFSFAHQKDCRTLLLDMDLSRSHMNELLGLKNSPSMDQLLQELAPAEDVFVRYADNLALATNARPVRFTSELLQNARTGEILKDVRRKLRPNVIICDMPPMLACDDLMAFLPNVDCAILVAAAETTKFAELDRCEQDLAEKTNLLGVVLNKCRYTQDEYGY